MSLGLNEAWAAGLFEGEGCIYLHVTRRAGREWAYLALSLVSTDKDVVERFQKIVGTGSISFERRRQPHHKDKYLWFARDRRATERVLSMIEPFLGERRLVKLAEVRARTSTTRRLPPKKTHCSKGHRLTATNSVPNGKSKITCRKCKNERQRQTYAQREGKR